MDRQEAPPVDLQDLRSALDFWDRMAADNGWKLGSLTVWVNPDGTVADSVGVTDGSGLYLVPASDDDDDDE